MSAPPEETRARGAVLSGHVDRLALFAEVLDDVHEVPGLPCPALRGRSGGQELLVLGTGMGGPATVRAAAALVDRGYQVLVRAGGAGPVGEQVSPGDLVIASAAVRHEGASAAFLADDEPAVADPQVLRSLVDAARTTFSSSPGTSWHVGVVHSKDSFFGEVDPGASPQAQRLGALWESWRRLGVLASEMEAAALFAVASARGARAGAVLRVNDVAVDSGAATTAQLQLCELATRATAQALGGDLDA